MNRKVLCVLVISIYLLATVAAAKRILFYEVGTGADYTIEAGYGKFAEELRKKNYEVASIEKGELTKDKLENYDILVIADINKQLTTGEISAIIWFVLQKGRGLLINGGGQGRANQLTIPFGVTVDNGMLIDTSDQIPSLRDRNSFTLDRFVDSPITSSLRQGVSKIGFYKDSGLILSGSAKCIVTGNGDTYSDTGSFAAGSEPCVAAASVFGGGLVFTMSDSDMLNDKYLTDYNNRNFGLNIIDWLGITTENISSENSTQELLIQIKEMRLENSRMQQQIKQLNEEKAELASRYTQANMQVTELQQQVASQESEMIGPFSRSNWAIIVLGVCILLAAIVYSKRRSTEVKIKDEDILSELGYELDSAQGGPGQPGVPQEKKG
jgi:hypothetical protein